MNSNLNFTCEGLRHSPDPQRTMEAPTPAGVEKSRVIAHPTPLLDVSDQRVQIDFGRHLASLSATLAAFGRRVALGQISP